MTFKCFYSNVDDKLEVFMAYAGVFSMLMNYKMQKLDSDSTLLRLQRDKSYAVEDLTTVSTYYDGAMADLKAQLDRGEITEAKYDVEIADLEKAFEDDKVAIAAEESDLEIQIDTEQVKNASLQTEIQNLQALLQNNITDAHTFGYTE